MAEEKTKVYELSHVTKIYENEGKKFTALKDVSLSVYEGEIFGIIGMSGAGKSTLVRTLNRLEEINEGTVSFYNDIIGDLKQKDLRKIRQSIAMIFQSFNLLNQKTVLENVALPLKIAGVSRAKRREKALEMLQVVGLEDKKDSYPARLSGGQKQRVAIARALAADPKVLLCDEATSALDPKITEEILELLQTINKTRNLTVIIITHEMSVVEKICDRVAIIDNGVVAEVGEVSEVFTNPKSDAAKRLVLPGQDEKNINPYDCSNQGAKVVRIVFDGFSAKEPVISTLVEDTGLKVNILSANTKSVGGKGYGQMIVELPKGEKEQETVLDFFEQRGIQILEVSA
ncbi:MAG: methionine ABC transporter ATP-binding protein [Lachnospiraceae bacterium]|nr:methionine ABC transporter ATP-binding protein [Lachnospiraceae bacterium]